MSRRRKPIKSMQELIETHPDQRPKRESAKVLAILDKLAKEPSNREREK